MKGAAAFGAIGPRIIAVIVNGTAQALEVCLIPTCKASAQAEDHGLDNLALPDIRRYPRSRFPGPRQSSGS